MICLLLKINVKNDQFIILLVSIILYCSLNIDTLLESVRRDLVVKFIVMIVLFIIFTSFKRNFDDNVVCKLAVLHNIFWLLAPVICIDAANILFVNPFCAKSHYIAIRPLGLELARRGHNVTIITANKESNPPSNYHEVMVDNIVIWDVLGIDRPNIFHMVNKSTQEFMNDVLWSGGYAFTEVILKSREVQEFLKKENKFDLIITEQFFQEALNILAYKYKAPLALVATVGNCMKHNLAVGNPLQLNTVMYEYLALRDSRSLWGRLRNIYAMVYEYVWWKYWYLGKQEALVAKYIPNLEEPVPSLFEVQKNASLMLINSHFTFDPPMALLPNIVEIGGMHLSRSDASLPKDLQDILDNCKYGVIYMNFGSNVIMSEMDKDKKEAFFKVFSKLKETVLLKWEEDIVSNKPDNVIIRKWFPQKEILEHPNIKVFISHGGLIGTQEAIFNGIPILGVPIYADQYNNLELIEQSGCGKVMDYYDITESTLENALKDILGNESFKMNAEKLSTRFKDRPMTPLDTAIWWLEYVLRHEGAEFMKSPERQINWFKYFMLDIYLVIAGIVLAVMFLIAIIVGVLKQFFRSQEKNEKKKKKRS